MTQAVTPAEILKTDRRGRVRFTSGRREELIEEFQKSGLSAPRYGKVTGLSYSTFATWLQKHRRKKGGLAFGVQSSNGGMVGDGHHRCAECGAGHGCDIGCASSF